jgi:nicotinamide mononucleotide adenylyltransferase
MKLRQLFENIYDVNEGGEEFDNSLKTIGVCFGRWNPPHKGHKAVWQAAATNPIWYVGTNQSTSGPKDPVPYDIKLQLMQAVWPKVAGHVIPEQSLLTLAARIYSEHGQNVHLKVYTDEEWLYKALSQYNGVEKEHGMYNFQQIDWVKTERLASATNLRAAVRSGDRKSFYHDMGIKPSVTVEVSGQAYPVFDVVAHFLNKYPEKTKKAVVAEAYDGFGKFDAAEFSRHMAKLRAREELKKTDPVRALVGDLIDKEHEKERLAKRKKPDDDSIGIHDPRHPGYAYSQGGDTHRNVDEIAGAFPSPSTRAKWAADAAASNRAEAARQAELQRQANAAAAAKLSVNTADVDRLNKVNYHGAGAPIPSNATWDGDSDFLDLDGTKYNRAMRMPISGDVPPDMKLYTTKEGRQVYIWTRNSLKGVVGRYFYPAETPATIQESKEQADPQVRKHMMKKLMKHHGWELSDLELATDAEIQQEYNKLPEIQALHKKLRINEVAMPLSEVAMRMQGSSAEEKAANAAAKQREAEEKAKHQAIVQAYVKIMAAGQPLPPKMQQSYNTMPDFRKEVDAALANIPGQPGVVDLEQRKNYHLMPKFESMSQHIEQMEADLHESSQAKISKRKQQSTAGLNTYGDSEHVSGDYTAYRLGMAVAGANGKDPIDMKAKSWIGKKKSTHPYTQEEQDMLKQAYEAVGAEYTDLNAGDMKSKELDSTHKVSPVAAPKRNKYGV